MDRRSTSAATLAVLLLLCVLAFVFGLKGLSSDLPDDPIVEDPEASCVDQEITAGTKVRPADVLVSVYNGGTRSGVASKTMSTLQIRGFAAGQTGNEPDADVRMVQVWGDRDNPAVRLVAAQFGSETRIIPSRKPTDGGADQGVVVVVGDAFKKLGRRVASVTAEADTTICSPFK